MSENNLSIEIHDFLRWRVDLVVLDRARVAALRQALDAARSLGDPSGLESFVRQFGAAGLTPEFPWLSGGSLWEGVSPRSLIELCAVGERVATATVLPLIDISASLELLLDEHAPQSPVWLERELDSEFRGLLISAPNLARAVSEAALDLAELRDDLVWWLEEQEEVIDPAAAAAQLVSSWKPALEASRRQVAAQLRPLAEKNALLLYDEQKDS